MLKVLIYFSTSEFLPFFSWCFAVAKEMQLFGFGLELAVKLLKSPQSSSWNESLLVTAWSCSLINYLEFYCNPAQLATLTNGWLLCVCCDCTVGDPCWSIMQQFSENGTNLAEGLVPTQTLVDKYIVHLTGGIYCFDSWTVSMLAFPSHWMFRSFPSRIPLLLNYW